MPCLPMLLIWVLYTVVEGYSDEYSAECEEEYPGTDFTFCGEVPIQCEDTKYRSYNGSCNNLDRSWYGTPMTPYLRPPCSISTRTETIYDESYPSPRKLSNTLFVDLKVDHQLWTLAFMQYGQIIAHDLSLTQGVPQTKKDAIACCTPDGKPTSEAFDNPRCAPIRIPEDDPYNGPEGRTCMDFLRVATTNDVDCVNPTDIPEPLTAVTSYLDVGYLYGNNYERAKRVRAFKGGRLAYVMRNRKMVLPQDPEPELTCDIKSKKEPCYFTGDVRVNQNPQLALLHNLFMEHHNYIADGLAKLNPHWNDETLFQESRKIVIGIQQMITFYEFVPELIGEEYTKKNELSYPDAKGYIYDYDPSVHPGVRNEFSACAFRIFHSEIVGKISVKPDQFCRSDVIDAPFFRSFRENRNTSNVISLESWFDRPSICEHADNFNGLMRGLITQSLSAVDRYMAKEILNLLFKEEDQLLGLDLKAIDIQRGRDQRVRSFAEAVRACNLGNPQTWKDMEQFIKPQLVSVLKHLYKSPSQLELCVALQLETSLPDLLVGPVSQCILGEQFYRTRVGDRCFFENGYGKCAFTPDQLQAIRKSSMAQIFCINKDIKRIQPQAFKQISKKNPLKWCKDIPKLDLHPWKESKKA